VQDFLVTFKGDQFLRDLLHLAICMSNTALEEATLALLHPPVINVDSSEPGKPPPRKGTALITLFLYIHCITWISVCVENIIA